MMVAYTQMEPFNNYPDHAGMERRPEDDGLQPMPMYSPQQKYHETPKNPQLYQQYPAYVQEPPKAARTICGLGVTVFWLVLLLGFITIAAIVGGTVGGVLGAQKAANNVVTTTIAPSATSSLSTLSIGQSGPATNTATPTNTAVTHTGSESLPSASSTVVRAGCPIANGTKWTSASGYSTFGIFCSTDFPGNDLIGGAYLPLENFDACLDYCASLNDARNFTLCYGVAYNWEETPGYCYLKNPGYGLVALEKSSLTTDCGILEQLL